MSLLISLPQYCQSELKWTCSVLFGDFLGLDYHIVKANDEYISIGCEGRKIVLAADFFVKANHGWLSPESLPATSLSLWENVSDCLNISLIEQPLPVLYGVPKIEISDDIICIGVDILGSVFFMLSRYEEGIEPERDEHDRFPSTASVAGRAGFLDRPIVDEYVEVLWAAIHQLWPKLERKIRKPRTVVSCDVDIPYVCRCHSVCALPKRLCGDILKRRSFSMAVQSLTTFIRGQQDDYSRDPYLNAIDWIMDVNEKAGNRVAFYFITAHTHPTLDGCYNMEEPVIRKLLRRIAARGHEIGLHASYNTYQDATQICYEADILRQAMANEGVEQLKLGGRQHFLRWQTPITAHNLEAAGIDYDSSLCFADRPGFRCGTCHEYQMYDLAERRALKLLQRPLVLMESSVINKRYMGMGYCESALELMQSYKQACFKFGGAFTLLWHNSHFTNRKDKEYYLELINPKSLQKCRNVGLAEEG